MNISRCKEQGIPFWPDNDGGLWCYVPGTGHGKADFIKINSVHGVGKRPKAKVMTFVGGKSAETVTLAGSNSGSIRTARRYKAVNAVADLNAITNPKSNRPVPLAPTTKPSLTHTQTNRFTKYATNPAPVTGI